MTDLWTSIILGLPGDDVETGRASIEFVRDLNVKSYVHSELFVFPGTRLFDEAEFLGIRVEPAAYGLPYRTRHSYDVSRIRPLPNAMQLEVEEAIERDLSGLITGEERSPDGAHPLQVLLNDFPGRLEQHRHILSNALSLSAPVVLLGDDWCDSKKDEWHQWAAANRLVVPRPRFVNGSLGPVARPDRTLGLHSPLWRNRVFCRWSFEGASTLSPAVRPRYDDGTRVFLTLDSEEDLSAFESLLEARAFSLPARGFVEGPVRVVDACRWKDEPCPALSLTRMICTEGCVYPCFAGRVAGRAEEPPDRWRRRIREAVIDQESARGCGSCDAASSCSRCPFTGGLRPEDFCRSKRRHRGWRAMLGLLQDLSTVIAAVGGAASASREAAEIAVIRATTPESFFLITGPDAMVKFDTHARKASRLGETLQQALVLIRDGLSGSDLVQRFSASSGRGTIDAESLLREFQDAHGLPAQL